MGTLDSIETPILVLIMVIGFMLRYGGWGRGRTPPRGPFL